MADRRIEQMLANEEAPKQAHIHKKNWCNYAIAHLIDVCPQTQGSPMLLKPSDQGFYDGTAAS